MVVLFLTTSFFILLFWLWYTTKFGAPFVPLSPETVEAVFTLAKVKPGERFYDLGSGDGRVVTVAALAGANAFGVEIDPLRVWYSRFWIRVWGIPQKAQILHTDFFNINLSNADVVFLYLLQETNDKIVGKLEKELKSETKVISVAFTLPNWSLEAFIPNTPNGPVYLYKK